MTAAPSTEWKEQIAPDEEQRFLGYAEFLRDVQRRVNARGTGRALHRKAHFGAEATFEVLSGIPAPADAGLFAKPATYKAYVRFSNGGPFVKSDSTRDIRGLAIKVVGVEGKKLIPGMEDKKTQDFLMIHVPTAGIRDTAAFMSIVRANVGNPLLTLPRLIGAFGFGAFPMLAKLVKALGPAPASMARVRFYTAVPIQWGKYAAKLTLTPVGDEAAVARGKSKNYLAEELSARLASKEVAFEMGVQLYRDEKTTPIEDGRVIWSETDAPVIPVARLTLPKQDSASERGKRLSDALDKMSFNPWHALVEHKPLGDIMRARNPAYRLSTQERGAAGEPDGTETF